jgi:thioredoxin domain-containing protein 5
VSVNILDENNFNDFVSKGFHFTKFYAPWCGHCQKLAPIWDQLGQKFLEEGRIVKISKIDCTQSGIICQDQGVRGYPTLIFFHDGKQIEKYTGDRTLISFSAFIDNLVNVHSSIKVDPSDQQANTMPLEVLMGNDISQRDFYDQLAKPGVFFVKFYVPWCEHCKAMATAWAELDNKMKGRADIRIGSVNCMVESELCKAQSVNGYPTLMLFRNGLKETNYENSRDLEHLLNFVNSQLVHEDL